MAAEDLNYERLDDLAIAVEDGELGPDAALPHPLVANRLGPLLELTLLQARRHWPPGIVGMLQDGALQGFMSAFRADRKLWIEPSGAHGFMRLGDDFGDDEELRWTGFGLKMDKAMQAAGLPKDLAGQLVGGTKELHSNVYEHSEKSRSGIVAFAVHTDMAEFVVADSGIGVLASLRSSPAHAGIERDGEALRLALQPGVSRYAGEPLRGHGFDLMFTGMLNSGSKLRFRSGAAAVTIDGLSKDNPVPIIRDRPRMEGFLIAVDCHAIDVSRRAAL